MPTLQGKILGTNRKLGIVVARFNEFITKRLLDSALQTLNQAGVLDKSIRVAWVPGALEVPFFCKKMIQEKQVEGLIALACVLRGGTYHFECVSWEVTRGISQVSLETGIPIATGVITADNLEQAIDRAGLKSGNKGAQAALACLEMIDLSEQIVDRKSKKRQRPKKKL